MHQLLANPAKSQFPGTSKEAGLFCVSFLRKGEVLAYVGRIHNLKDLKEGDVVGYLHSNVIFRPETPKVSGAFVKQT